MNRQHKRVAIKLADELLHTDQDVTIGELEGDIATQLDMNDYIDEQLPEITNDEKDSIRDKAFEIARDRLELGHELLQVFFNNN